MKSSLTNRQKQAIKTKNKIFDTTIELIEKNGYHNVNIEDICKKTNVSIGTFYYYYKSKNDVFFELYMRADKYFMSHVKDHLKQEKCVARIVEYFDHYAIYIEKRGLHTMQQIMNTENKGFIKKGRELQKLLIEIIEEGKEKGEIDSGMTSEGLCEFFFIIVRGIIFDWCLHNGAYDVREKISQYLKPVVNTIQAGPQS